jgi:hypothetical protein
MIDLVGSAPSETVCRVARAIYAVDPISEELPWDDLLAWTKDIYLGFAEAAIAELQECALVCF